VTKELMVNNAIKARESSLRLILMMGVLRASDASKRVWLINQAMSKQVLTKKWAAPNLRTAHKHTDD
jgi:hypothetical protein